MLEKGVELLVTQEGMVSGYDDTASYHAIMDFEV